LDGFISPEEFDNDLNMNVLKASKKYFWMLLILKPFLAKIKYVWDFINHQFLIKFVHSFIMLVFFHCPTVLPLPDFFFLLQVWCIVYFSLCLQNDKSEN
jgi:hypothetical protein